MWQPQKPGKDWDSQICSQLPSRSVHYRDLVAVGGGRQGRTKKRGFRQHSKELGKEAVLGIAGSPSSRPPEMCVCEILKPQDLLCNMTGFLSQSLEK